MILYPNDEISIIYRDASLFVISGIGGVKFCCPLEFIDSYLVKRLISSQPVETDCLSEQETKLVRLLIKKRVLSTLAKEKPVLSADLKNDVFLSYFGINPEQVRKRMRSARVLFLGCGGLSQVVLQHLSALGLRNICLIDGDKVEASNSNRQFLITINDLEKPKVIAVGNSIQRQYAGMNIDIIQQFVTSKAQLVEILERYSPELLVCGADMPSGVELKRMVSAACRVTRTPSIYGGVGIRTIEIGPLLVTEDDYSRYNQYMKENCSKALILRNDKPIGSIGITNTMAGILMAKECYAFLSGSFACKYRGVSETIPVI